MSHREARVAISEQDHILRSRNYNRCQQIEREEKEPLFRAASSDVMSSNDAEEQSSISQEDSMSNFSLRDSAVTMRHVVLNQNIDSMHHSSPQPSIFTTSLHIPSPVSHRKLSGILELNPPTSQASKLGHETIASPELLSSSPTSAHSFAHRPSHLLQKNSRLSSDSQSRTRNTTSMKTPSEDTAEARRMADCNFASNSEAEEDSGPPSRLPVGYPVRRDNAETRRGLAETVEHVNRKVELAKLPAKNQYLVDASDVRRSAQRLCINDTTVSKSGSFSIPAKTTYVSQLRPGPLGLDCRRSPSPYGFASRRPDISPRSLVSTISLLSLEGRPSRIPRPIQKSPRTSPAKASPGTPYEIRYSIYNVFTIVMVSGSDDRADPFYPSLAAVSAKESVVKGHSKCDVVMHKSYVYPTFHKIQTYEPVKISTKRSEIVSAVVAIQEPKVMRTLANVAKAGPAEKSDKHIILLTEFRDAVRVLQPVVPTDKPTVAKQGNPNAQPPADRATGTAITTQKTISMIPPVVLVNARIKKTKRSKSVQSKAKHSVKPSARHAVQSSIKVVQSTIHPGVQSSLPAVLHPLEKPTVQSLAQSVILPASRPERKNSSLLSSSIVEVSFTDLDKKAFKPKQLTKTRNSKDAGHASAASKAQNDASRLSLLNTASRSALKAIVKAILANSGVQLPEQVHGNRRDSTERVPHRHSQAKTSSSALVSTIPASQRKNWSLDEVNRASGYGPAREHRASGESYIGLHPLGSSVTQVFCKHRKQHHRHQSHAHENTTASWSKALYAKTLYFKNEMLENPQKQAYARNAVSSLEFLSSAANPAGGRSERCCRDHFRSSGSVPEWQRDSNLSSSNSVAAKFEDAFATLEQTVSRLLLSRYSEFKPIQVSS